MLALRPPGELMPFEEAVRNAGLDLEEAARLWRALGFPDPRAAPTRVTETRVQTLQVLAGMTRAMFDPDTTLRLARVIGSSTAQLAEAIVDAFRLGVEMPQRDRGTPVSQVVEDYARTAAVAIPALNRAIGDILVSHLLAVARAGWTLDDERTAITRELVIGFADLVGYTSRARGLAPAELAAGIDRFESLAAETIGRHGGRVVKLIGDEVMFTIDDPGQAVALALELIAEVGPENQLRVGLAAGPVVSHRGDYYGDVVNLAARLVKAARPGTALVSSAVSQAGAAVDIPAPKGFDRDVRVYELAPGCG